MTLSFKTAFAVAVTGLTFFAAGARAQDVPRPVDETPAVPFHADADPDAKDLGVDQDDATARLAWERAAWGIVTPAFRTNEIKQGNLHNTRKNAPGPKWVSIGPGGADYEQNGSFTGHVRDSGRARAILPHPTNPDVVYVLTSGGGLWRTNNWSSANTTWTSLTDDLSTTGGGSVAFGKNPNTLYLGLGDPYDQILVGGSMVKSGNGGVSWSPMIELGSAVSVRDVKVDTSTNRDIVMVATDSGLYRSADDGAAYSAVSTFNGMSVWSIARTSAGWLASAQPCAAANTGLQCGGATTLYLSGDRGATWAPISNAGGVFSASGRTTLGVGQPGDAVVYAYSSTVGDAQMKDVWRSADGGQTWVANNVNSTKIPTNANGSMPNMNICQGQCWYDQMILVDPTDANRNTVWIGGNLAAAQTTNGGGTWTLKTWWLYSQVPDLPYAHADHHAAAFKSTGTPTIILGNDGGFDVSTDGGATFSSDKNNGLQTFLFYSIAGNPALPNLAISGAQDNGTRLRTDNSTTFNQVIGGDGLGANYSQANTAVLLGSSQGSGIRMNYTNNPGPFQNWVSRGALNDGAGAGFYTCIVAPAAGLDSTGKVFFHFTASRVFRTNDGGLTWGVIGSATAPLSPGLPATRRFRSSPVDLGVSPIDLKHVAVGAAGGFLDVTTDGGAHWTDINLIATVPGYQGFITNATWADNNTLWVTSVAQAAGSLRVLKGTTVAPDNWATATWQALQNGLPDLPVTRVYIDPRDPAHNTLYAATHVGIYRTTDGGANWAPYGNGLPTVRVNDIYMPPDGSFIRIATYGRGDWELAQLELAGTKLDDSGSSCDGDGVLDNGETGKLTVTLMNQGPNNVNHVTLTLSSSNPHVTFPGGNVLYFPPVQKNGSSTGSIQVALNGASGIETTDFKIAIDSPELAVGAFNVTSTQRMNYDEVASSSATETAEESGFGGWTGSGGSANSPNIYGWQRRDLSPTSHVWWGPDNNGQINDEQTAGDMIDDQYLTSPSMHVGTGALSIKFSHRFAFENGGTLSGQQVGFDAGVIELSTDGGATWTDVGASVYNGKTRPDASLSLGPNKPAFVNRMVGWPTFATVTLNLGTTYANKDVMVRFHTSSDENTGAPGWEIDDIAVNGITNTPFTSLVTNACSH